MPKEGRRDCTLRMRASGAIWRADSYLSLRCLFAGTLHNRSELIRELEADPSLDAVATLLRAYARWGDGLLDRLEGVFALVIWDQDSETLLAARDPMGLYPLFYSRTGRTLLLSNSIKALVGQPDVSGRRQPAGPRRPSSPRMALSGRDVLQGRAAGSARPCTQIRPLGACAHGATGIPAPTARSTG